MSTYTAEQIAEVLRKHKLWLENKEGGERADLRGADLTDADLRGADLRDADLRGADIDYASWPIWCGSLRAKVDDRIAVQLLYHVLRVVQYSQNVSEEVKTTLLTPEITQIANRFHRAAECGEIAPKEDRSHA